METRYWVLILLVVVVVLVVYQKKENVSSESESRQVINPDGFDSNVGCNIRGTQDEKNKLCKYGRCKGTGVCN
jgi:hypothetical protein